MSNRIHALAQQLTGKVSVEDCSIEEVRQIAQRYPYFAPAQFLLVQKLQESNSPDLESQQRKAVLFFPDPLMFDYFISSDNFYTDGIVAEDNIDLQPVIIDQGEKHSDVTDGITDTELVIASDPIEKVAVVEEEITGPANDNQAISFSKEGLSEEVSAGQEISQQITDSTENLEVSDHSSQNYIPEDISVSNAASITELQIEDETRTAADATEHNVAANVPTEELAFEPFHTVDYFASQGIKVSQDGLPNDRLGKQLKSFTDWLKTMKRLPAAQINGQVEMIAEKKVENMASRSVSESSVITEAMAEVWAKQGNKEKAVETYNKLSLLNPAKKAFFAAKIENLKTS
jgi:hypothetical protein